MSVVGKRLQADLGRHPIVAPYPSRPELEHPALAALPKLTQCFPNLVLGTVAVATVSYRVPYPQAIPIHGHGRASETHRLC